VKYPYEKKRVYLNRDTPFYDLANRPSRLDIHYDIVKLIAKRSTCARASVGAILIYRNRIISSGYNGAPANKEHCNPVICDTSKACSRVTHAEANCLNFASEVYPADYIRQSILVITHQPCLKCAELIVEAGIREVHYLTPYRLHEGLILLKDKGVKVVTEEKNATPTGSNK